MTEIYLIRHTQAEGNLYRVMQGSWDSDATDTGVEQVEKLAERFKNIHVDAVYSSDLKRAVFTATAAARHDNLEIHKDKGLREINMGPWEQKFFGNVCYDQPEDARIFMSESEKWDIEGAETFGQVKERAYSTLEKIAKENDGKTIAVVSHGVTIRCLLSKIKNVPLSDIKNCPICKNTAVSKLTYDNGTFTCDYLNDYSHLGELGNYHWWKTADLRDELVDIEQIEPWYREIYEDAWEIAHNGNMFGCNLDFAIKQAKNQIIYKIYDENKPVGLIQLDEDKDNESKFGWISLLYLCEEYRNKGYGIQVIARAYQRFREDGFSKVRLSVFENNKAAIKFYEKNKFIKVGEEKGSQGILYLMERDL